MTDLVNALLLGTSGTPIVGFELGRKAQGGCGPRKLLAGEALSLRNSRPGSRRG